MELRTITIKSVEKTQGTKKDGTTWNRVSIKATDGKFYSSFAQLPAEALAEGSELKVEVIPSKLANTYEIKKLISYTLPRQVPEDAGRGDLPTPSVANAPRQEIKEAQGYAEELLTAAQAAAHKKCAEWEGMSEYPYLIAELIHSMHGRISNKEIAAENERKYKLWGGKV